MSRVASPLSAAARPEYPCQCRRVVGCGGPDPEAISTATPLCCNSSTMSRVVSPPSAAALPECCRQCRRAIGCGGGDGFLTGLEAVAVRLLGRMPISLNNVSIWALESVIGGGAVRLAGSCAFASDAAESSAECDTAVTAASEANATTTAAIHLSMSRGEIWPPEIVLATSLVMFPGDDPLCRVLVALYGPRGRRGKDRNMVNLPRQAAITLCYDGQRCKLPSPCAKIAAEHLLEHPLQVP
jgi:hypothetical protein